jgi:hypothetical protein
MLGPDWSAGAPVAGPLGTENREVDGNVDASRVAAATSAERVGWAASAVVRGPATGELDATVGDIDGDCTLDEISPVLSDAARAGSV